MQNYQNTPIFPALCTFLFLENLSGAVLLIQLFTLNLSKKNFQLHKNFVSLTSILNFDAWIQALSSISVKFSTMDGSCMESLFPENFPRNTTNMLEIP